MAHNYDTGWVAHTPAWHRLADIKGERPTSWDEARKGYLDWEPVRKEIFTLERNGLGGTDMRRIEGWHQIVRSDDEYGLTIQEDSYAVIGNAEIGSIVEFIMGMDLPGMPGFEYEALSVLRRGRIIAVSLFMKEAFHIPGDPSATYGFINLWTRHDGQGGLKGGAGTFRVVCSNTQMAAEAQMAKHGFMFNIRHTKNWASQLEDARRGIVMASGGIEAQQEIAVSMAKRRVSNADVGEFVEQWLPYAEDMTSRQRVNVSKRRDAFWLAYMSETCEGITDTVYGVVQAAVEACDHYFPARNEETRAARILLGEYGPKRRALAIARRLG